MELAEELEKLALRASKGVDDMPEDLQAFVRLRYSREVALKMSGTRRDIQNRSNRQSHPSTARYLFLLEDPLDTQDKLQLVLRLMNPPQISLGVMETEASEERTANFCHITGSSEKPSKHGSTSSIPASDPNSLESICSFDRPAESHTKKG
jgi:hypothetical protein